MISDLFPHSNPRSCCVVPAGAEGTDFYIYVETSGAECNTAGETAIVYQSPGLEFDAQSGEQIKWWNNMFGGSIGNLTLQENTTGSWITMWEQIGNHSTAWFTNTTDLSGLTGPGTLRFYYVCAGGFTGDVAIDEINISYSGTAAQVWQNSTGWNVNVTVPSFGPESGLKNLTVNATGDGGTANDIELRAVNYGVNNLPTVTLIGPVDGVHTIDRTPLFNWSQFDADGDPVTFELNISCYHDAGPGCSDDDRDIKAVEFNSTTIFGDLQYLSDNNYYYNWTVRANDSTGFGPWADPFVLRIDSYVDIRLLVSEVIFGPLGEGESNDTVDNSPPPFVLENNGTVFVNVTINASDLWTSASNPTGNYTFKIDNSTTEPGAFHWGMSNTTFVPMPVASTPTLAIALFNYLDSLDELEIDINITVPIGESTETKESMITLIASLAE